MRKPTASSLCTNCVHHVHRMGQNYVGGFAQYPQLSTASTYDLPAMWVQTTGYTHISLCLIGTLYTAFHRYMTSVTGLLIPGMHMPYYYDYLYINKGEER